MDKTILKAGKRKILGRKVKGLRKSGIIPANIFGKEVKSEAIELMLTDFEKVFSQTGETGLIELIVDNKKNPVLVHNVQKDPVSDSFLHVDFMKVDLKKKVSAEVPVELINESPAEKQGLGTVVQYVDEVEVEALPTNLPEKFEIDLTKLNQVDEAIYIKDLGKLENVDIINEPDQIIVKVEPLRAEEVEVPPTPAEAPKEEAEGEQKEQVEEKVEEKEKVEG